jgi:hypothetical protein
MIYKLLLQLWRLSTIGAGWDQIAKSGYSFAQELFKEMHECDMEYARSLIENYLALCARDQSAAQRMAQGHQEATHLLKLDHPKRFRAAEAAEKYLAIYNLLSIPAGANAYYRGVVKSGLDTIMNPYLYNPSVMAVSASELIMAIQHSGNDPTETTTNNTAHVHRELAYITGESLQCELTKVRLFDIRKDTGKPKSFAKHLLPQ